MKRERRFLTVGDYQSADRQVTVDFRVDDEDDGIAKIRGHAAVFNSPTEIYGMREIVRPGAFRKAIVESDIRGLFNHDPNFVLGRNRSSTMEVSEDSIGLAYAINAPATDLIRDLVIEPIRRGDVDGSSFGFRTVRDRMTHLDEDTVQREIIEAELFDVGPVTFPAYEASDSDFRSMLKEARSLGEVELLAEFRNSGLTDGAIHAICIRVAEITAEGSQREPDPAILLNSMRRKLDLASAEV